MFRFLHYIGSDFLNRSRKSVHNISAVVVDGKVVDGGDESDLLAVKVVWDVVAEDFKEGKLALGDADVHKALWEGKLHAVELVHLNDPGNYFQIFLCLHRACECVRTCVDLWLTINNCNVNIYIYIL